MLVEHTLDRLMMNGEHLSAFIIHILALTSFFVGMFLKHENVCQVNGFMGQSVIIQEVAYIMM